MRKFFALMICALLVFTCTVSAFAAEKATPDETGREVVAIEVQNVPKTSYSFMYDTDFDLTEEQWEDLLFGDYDEDYIESVLLSSFVIYLDLEDAQILATYSDGTSEYINPDDCTATVLDMPTSFEDEEFFRDFTVQVEYMGCTDTYTINIYDDMDEDFPDEENDYVVVDVVPPTKNVYNFEECDAYPASEVYPGLSGYFFDIDETGLTVTLLNKTTGELEVYSDDSLYCYSVYVDELSVELKKGGNISVFGEVYTDNWDIVPFEFTVKLVFDDETLNQEDTEDEDNNVSTKDIATKDSKSPTVPTNALVGNKVVNTGQVFPATIVLVVVGCLAMGTLILYRKRESK